MKRAERNGTGVGSTSSNMDNTFKPRPRAKPARTPSKRSATATPAAKRPTSSVSSSRGGPQAGAGVEQADAAPSVLILSPATRRRASTQTKRAPAAAAVIRHRQVENDSDDEDDDSDERYAGLTPSERVLAKRYAIVVELYDPTCGGTVPLADSDLDPPVALAAPGRGSNKRSTQLRRAAKTEEAARAASTAAAPNDSDSGSDSDAIIIRPRKSASACSTPAPAFSKPVAHSAQPPVPRSSSQQNQAARSHSSSDSDYPANTRAPAPAPAPVQVEVVRPPRRSVHDVNWLKRKRSGRK